MIGSVGQEEFCRGSYHNQSNRKKASFSSIQKVVPLPIHFKTAGINIITS